MSSYCHGPCRILSSGREGERTREKNVIVLYVRQSTVNTYTKKLKCEISATGFGCRVGRLESPSD